MAATAAIAPQAQVAGAVLREIDASAAPQGLIGVSQVSNMLNGLLGRAPAGSAPTGYSEPRSVTASASLGSVRYLRDQGDELGAGGRGKVASNLPPPAEDPKTALKNLNSLLTDNPMDDKSLALRARAENALGKYQEAEADARKVILIDPNNALAWSQLAWSLFKQKKYKEALEAIDRAILANPKSASNYAIRAYARYMLGDAAGAMKDMETAAALDPAYRPQLEAFRKGGKLYDPDEDAQKSILLSRTMSRLPAGTLLAFLLAIGLAGWYARGVYAGWKQGKVVLRKLSSPTASKIVSDAMLWQGTPYGTGPGQSDCAFFTQKVYGGNGIRIPRDVGEQFDFFNNGVGGSQFIPDAQDLKPGDAVFLGNGSAVDHVGIVTGNEDGIINFLDANTRDRAITPSSFLINDGNYGKRVFMGGGRIPAVVQASSKR